MYQVVVKGVTSDIGRDLGHDDKYMVCELVIAHFRDKLDARSFSDNCTRTERYRSAAALIERQFPGVELSVYVRALNPEE